MQRSPIVVQLLTAVSISLIFANGQARANVVGTDFQNFNPTTNGIDFVTVQSSETLAPGILNLGLFINYGVNALPEFENEGLVRTERGGYRNSILGSDFNIGLGLLPRWDIGISFPATLQQEVKRDSDRIQYEERGLNEIRINTKVQFFGNASRGLALIGGLSRNMIGNNAPVGVDGGPRSMLELAADTAVQRFAFGLNLGYMWRKPGKPVENQPLLPFGDTALASAAMSYLIKAWDAKAIMEVYGSAPAGKNGAKSMRDLQNTAEGLFGLKKQIANNFDFHIGAGTFLRQTAATPDYRVYSGINWTIGPMWRDENKAVTKTKRYRKKKELEKDSNKDSPADVLQPTNVEVSDQGTVDTYVIQNVLFALDSDYVVLPGAKDHLREVADSIKRDPAYERIVIEGHTDSWASDEYNMELSQRRANTIKKYLVKKLGFPESKLESIGYGESQPVEDNGNYQGRQLNRRVEIKVIRP